MSSEMNQLNGCYLNLLFGLTNEYDIFGEGSQILSNQKRENSTLHLLVVKILDPILKISHSILIFASFNCFVLREPLLYGKRDKDSNTLNHDN